MGRAQCTQMNELKLGKETLSIPKKDHNSPFSGFGGDLQRPERTAQITIEHDPPNHLGENPKGGGKKTLTTQRLGARLESPRARGISPKREGPQLGKGWDQRFGVITFPLGKRKGAGGKDNPALGEKMGKRFNFESLRILFITFFHKGIRRGGGKA